MKDCPKLDNDFSRWIIINGAPEVDEKKSEKFSQLLIKLFDKKNFKISESDI